MGRNCLFAAFSISVLLFVETISQQTAVLYVVDQNGQVIENERPVAYFSGPIQPPAAPSFAAAAPPRLAPPNNFAVGARRSRLFPNGFRFDSTSMRRLGDVIGQFLSGFLGANKGGGALNLDALRSLAPGRRRGQRGRIRGRLGGLAGLQGDPVIGSTPDAPPTDPIPPVISSSLDSELETLDYFEDPRFMPTARGTRRPPSKPAGQSPPRAQRRPRPQAPRPAVNSRRAAEPPRPSQQQQYRYRQPS